MNPESTRETAAAPLAMGFDYAEALAAQDQELVDIVQQPFIEQWPVDLEKIESALALGDFKGVMYTVHALKGTLLMFGAVPASQLASEMQAFAASGEAAPLAVRWPIFKAEVEQLLRVLRKELAQ
jgi:HPt (histidine-containing phosphotransfer) domain-containing protein